MNKIQQVSNRLDSEFGLELKEKFDVVILSCETPTSVWIYRFYQAPSFLEKDQYIVTAISSERQAPIFHLDGIRSFEKWLEVVLQSVRIYILKSLISVTNYNALRDFFNINPLWDEKNLMYKEYSAVSNSIIKESKGQCYVFCSLSRFKNCTNDELEEINFLKSGAANTKLIDFHAPYHEFLYYSKLLGEQ